MAKSPLPSLIALVLLISCFLVVFGDQIDASVFSGRTADAGKAGSSAFCAPALLGEPSHAKAVGHSARFNAALRSQPRLGAGKRALPLRPLGLSMSEDTDAPATNGDMMKARRHATSTLIAGMLGLSSTRASAADGEDNDNVDSTIAGLLFLGFAGTASIAYANSGLGAERVALKQMEEANRRLDAALRIWEQGDKDLASGQLQTADSAAKQVTGMCKEVNGILRALSNLDQEVQSRPGFAVQKSKLAARSIDIIERADQLEQAVQRARDQMKEEEEEKKKEEEERKRKEEEERKRKEEEERKRKEEEERKRKEEEERKGKEEEERKRKEEEERKRKEEEERKQKEEEERQAQAKAEGERKAREEEERKKREEEEKQAKAKAEEERKRREEEERAKAKAEEEERRAREEAERKAKEEAEKRAKAAEEEKEEKERKEKEERERKEQERKEKELRLRKEEAELQARLEAERKAADDTERLRKQKEESLRQAEAALAQRQADMAEAARKEEQRKQQEADKKAAAQSQTERLKAAEEAKARDKLLGQKPRDPEEDEIQNLLRRNPRDVEVLCRYARYLQAKEDYEKASMMYIEALLLDPVRARTLCRTM